MIACRAFALSGIAFLLAASSTNFPAATLSYPGGAKAVLLTSPRGITYRLSLITDPNIDGRVEDLTLVLHRPQDAAQEHGNLLDATGMLHGYQPYDFAGVDYKHGARRSSYGETRTLELRKLGMKFSFTVTHVQVRLVPNHEPGDPGYEFRNLTLRVVVQPL